jgi:hypothetical protein
MTMPLSGALSMRDTNTELLSTLTNDTTTTRRSFNDAKVRALFEIPSGAISMQHGYGKSRALIATSKVITVSQSGLLVRVQNAYYGGGIPPRIFALGSWTGVSYGVFFTWGGGVNGNARWHYENYLHGDMAVEMNWTGGQVYAQSQGRAQEMYTISASEYIVYDNNTTSNTFLGSQNMGANYPEWYPAIYKYPCSAETAAILYSRRNAIVGIIDDINARVASGSTITYA